MRPIVETRADQMFRTTAEANGEGLYPVKHVEAPSNLLLTVPRRHFCCCSSMLHVMPVCI